MRLTGEGLFVVDTGEPLSPALFAALLARGAPFAVKADYRGLPPPIEELDLVHLVPAADRVPAGTLVLHALDDGGFELTRRPPAGGRLLARVVSVERPGQCHDLARRRWRVLSRWLAASPGFADVYTATRSLFVRVWRPMPPATAPLRIAAADDIVADVRAKWAAPAEVRHTVSAGRALESWEKDLIERLVPARARILVIGCGAGRESLAFAERGFRVTGIDFVGAVVDEARRRAAAAALPVTFETTTAEAFAERAPGGFDAVIATAPVYEQTPGRARRVGFLRALARLAAPGGLIVLCAASHRDRGPRRTVIDGARWLLRRLGVPSIAEPGDRFTYHVSLASHHATKCFYHRFQRPEEIARELGDAGLAGTSHPEGPWLVRTACAPSTADLTLALLRGDAPSRDADWERVAELSVREGVAPLVFSRLEKTKVPDDVRTRLGAIYERTWARNAVLSRRWMEIVRALEAVGVRALALKGMALLQTTYADAGVRPMADLDVLVPESDFERAHAALVRDGWTAADGPDAAANAYRGYAHLTRAGAVLDLHRELAGYPRVAAVVRVDHAGLWSRAQRLPGGGWRLEAEDQLLHLALHLVLGSEFGRLLNFVDVDRVVRDGGLRWDVLLQEAGRWRVRAVLSYVLHVAARALGTPVPPEVLASLAPSVSSRLAERVLGTTGIPTLGARPSELRLYLAETLLMDRARWAARVAMTTLFPPAPWLRFHYGARSRGELLLARALHPPRVCARIVAPRR